MDQKLNFMIVCGELGARQRQRHFDLSTPRTSLVFLKDKIESERDYFLDPSSRWRKKNQDFALFQEMFYGGREVINNVLNGRESGHN